ncbi:hypothetical protein JI739_18535 [Ramlibacter sp. AW1]|uniref:Uncharacterized protein n=1 Tax=Ramlibacter aurantiacus TaxID=2801330 RepID=A0A936ZK35_9BURK|nr:hypothetical protein [Ramlibacter aurantiacus]MBL0422352.1 hypothetical protein [Ramlibacter aurantiacus]
MVSVSRRKRESAALSALRRHHDSEPPPQGGHQPEVEDESQRVRRLEKAKPLEKPDAGRTTKLGRKVESPASIKTAGPSGQRGSTQHQKQHTNK